MGREAEAMNRKSALKRKFTIVVDDGDRVKPTPQTVERLTPDPIARLVAEGKLSTDDERAALAIAAAIRIVASPLYTRSSRPDLARGSRTTASGAAADWAVECELRYLAWAEDMHDLRHPIGPVLDFVLDGVSLRALEKKWRRRHGTLLPQIKDALALYWRRR